MPMPELQAKLESSPDGLTQAEAQKRLAEYGSNEIEEKKSNPFLKFLTYLWGPIPWMIEAAVVLSALAQHWPDFGIILVLLLANAIVGFWEEHQAGNAIAALKAKLAIEARVKRDGKWVTPAARELVPGDVIRLRLGDIVPADARLLDGDSIEVDQSALTGESLPATRKPGEAVFSGSIVRQGEISALVYATGANTYFGKTAELVQEAHTVSHFQRAVLKIGDYLIILAVALVAVIIAVSIIRGDPILTTLQFALVLTVAAIPVAMPTVLSVTMAVGARLLAKREAIVTRLAAIEELAGVDVLCADKTGTLTQNKLTLGDPFGVSGVEADDVILCAALASREEDKDTIDMAVLDGLKDAKALKGYKVLHFQPFDPVHKRTEATVKETDGKTFQVAKGAPQVILEMSANAGEVKAAVEEAVALVRAASKEGRAWVRTLDPLKEAPPVTARRTRLLAPAIGEHAQFDEAVRAWRRGVTSTDRIAAASAISAAIEFYVARVEVEPSFEPTQIAALRQAIKTTVAPDETSPGVTDRQRQRIDDMLAGLALRAEGRDPGCRSRRVVAEEEHRRRPGTPGEIRQYRWDLVPPHGHHDEVVGVVGVEPFDERHPHRRGQAAAGVLEHDSVFAQLRRAGASGEQRDVVARRAQSRSVEAPDHAGAVHEDPHAGHSRRSEPIGRSHAALAMGACMGVLITRRPSEWNT
ncbi:MAG: HAD-IC family P-type ATPase [Candidatus Limnocylindrales bacterium]